MSSRSRKGSRASNDSARRGKAILSLEGHPLVKICSNIRTKAEFIISDGVPLRIDEIDNHLNSALFQDPIKESIPIDLTYTKPPDPSGFHTEPGGILRFSLSPRVISCFHIHQDIVHKAKADFGLLRTWISLNNAKVGAGNPFGRTVQDTVESKLICDFDSFSSSDCIKYIYQELMKVFTYPNVDAFRPILEARVCNLVGAVRNDLRRLRNIYLISYDLIHKNMEKLTDPTGTVSEYIQC